MRIINNLHEANLALAEFRRSQSVGRRPYSLDTIKRFMNSIGNPQNKLKVIHVAGTSGKTSTAYYIDGLLRQQGYRVGLTVSPHVDKVSERVQINGEQFSETEYCRRLSEFLDIVDANPHRLTYFEVLVAFAYWEFARNAVDYAVVEVGLGGLLDGTNIVDRPDKVSVITDIGLDHTEILGKSLQEIAAQKAGIILPKNHVFIQRQNSQVLQTVQEVCRQRSAVLHTVTSNGIRQEDFDLPKFQLRNLNLAKKVADYVIAREGAAPLKLDATKKAAQIYIPARMEAVRYADRTLILDGSHNQQKLQSLVDSIKEVFGSQSVAVLVSFGTNKRAGVVAALAELRKLSDDIILTKFSVHQDEFRQAIDPEELKAICEELNFDKIQTINNPVIAFCELVAKNKVLLVTGSYFLLNHVRPIAMFDYTQEKNTHGSFYNRGQNLSDFQASALSHQNYYE